MAPSLWEAEPQTPVEVQGNVDATGQGLISGLSFDTSRQDFSCFWRNVFIRFIYLEKIIIRAVTKTLHGHPGHFCFRFSGVVVVHLWYHCIIYVYAEVSVLSSSYETFSYVFNLFLKTDKSLCCVHVLIIRICTPQAYLAVYYPSIQCQCDIWDGFNTPPQRYLILIGVPSACMIMLSQQNVNMIRTDACLQRFSVALLWRSQVSRVLICGISYHRWSFFHLLVLRPHGGNKGFLPTSPTRTNTCMRLTTH